MNEWMNDIIQSVGFPTAGERGRGREEEEECDDGGSGKGMKQNWG